MLPLLALGAPGALGLPPTVDETGARHLAETLDGPPAALGTIGRFDDFDVIIHIVHPAPSPRL